MKIDLKNSLSEGVNLLASWRSKYPKQDYPEKVLINIFYRKYTMEFMWNEINNSFQKKIFGGQRVLWSDFQEGYKKLKNAYLEQSIKTQPILLKLLSDQKSRKVGSISYSDYTSLLASAKSGNQKAIEEIEYSYLYYLLADECTLIWSALGGTGVTKIDSIGKMSGLQIETDEIDAYIKIESIIGRLCASPYLKEFYNPLPPL